MVRALGPQKVLELRAPRDESGEIRVKCEQEKDKGRAELFRRSDAVERFSLPTSF